MLGITLLQCSLPLAWLLQFGFKAMAFSARLPLPLQLQASRRNCNGYVLKYLNTFVTVGRGTLLRFMYHGDNFEYGGIFGIMPLQFWLALAWQFRFGFKFMASQHACAGSCNSKQAKQIAKGMISNI